MIQNFRLISQLRICVIGASALLALSTASAQTGVPTTSAKASANHQQELRDCKTGRTNQDTETCLKEARNAQAERKRGALTKPETNYEANATTRCEALTGEYKVACFARMKGYGTTSGSVAAGGVLRQSETVVVPAAGAVTVTPKTDGPLVVIPSTN